MRRRALLAASAASGGGGGEFYCELWRYSPRDGGYIYVRTATFTIPTQMTWGDVEGLADTEELFVIFFEGIVPCITSIEEHAMFTNYCPEDIITIDDNIEVGKTYKFLYG